MSRQRVVEALKGSLKYKKSMSFPGSIFKKVMPNF